MSEPAHTYVIVAPPRSASTALARILWQHHAVRFYAHEPYGAVYHEGAPPATAEEALREPVDLDETVGGKSAEAAGLVVKEMTFQVGRCFPDLAAHTEWPVVFNVRIVIMPPKRGAAKRSGPRAVPCSQRLRVQERLGFGLNIAQRSWLLRAGDGSRSGGRIRMRCSSTSALETISIKIKIRARKE